MDSPKYRVIFDSLHKDILDHRYEAGERLPSEADLVLRFDASRMTVLKAIKELQALGLVTRRVGSGTYLTPITGGSGHAFGLLIPALGETEIFEAICQGMMQSPKAKEHTLHWGDFAAADNASEQVAEELCERYIAQRVSGVFFAPIEYAASRHRTNQKIVAALDRARIPIVLLDRCITPYPGRSKYDLVAIDNHRAGYLATEHLLQSGATRIAFFAKPESAPTVEARIAGYRQALASLQKTPRRAEVFLGDPEDGRYVASILRKSRPDAFVCANDLTAGHLMQSLLKLRKRIPEEIRMIGMDDVKFARLLPVPLTTVHQPCQNLGKMALSAMLERIQNPDLPARELLLNCDLVVRRSCGASPAP